MQYELISSYDLDIKDSPITIYNIGLRCDLDETPWCITPEQYQAIEDFKVNRDTLMPRDLYKLAPNGTYVKYNVTYEKPRQPMDFKYFTNLKALQLEMEKKARGEWP